MGLCFRAASLVVVVVAATAVAIGWMLSMTIPKLRVFYNHDDDDDEEIIFATISLRGGSSS